MTAVYLLRHPETSWNLAQRYQGRLDAPLSSQGRLQSRLLARSFAGESLDAVFSSPLQRALYLAREIAQAADAPLCIDQRLTELGQGAWEGLSVTEIRVRFPEVYEEWYTRPDRVRMPGGETVQEVQRRALCVLAAIQAHYPGGNVAVATHAVVVQSLAAAALALDLRYLHRLRIANASVTTLCGTDLPPSLLTLNDTFALHHSPVTAAAAQDCVSWKRRRITQ